MNRRRLLLSYLANSFSWELYSKVYFYNELVPTTINSKNVLNKAKIVKVSGNGVIENQLVQNGNFEDSSHWTVGGGTVSYSNNKATLTIGTGGNIEFYQPIQKQTGHKYIATFKAKTSYAQSLKLNWGATLNTFSLTTSEQVFSVLVNTLSGNNNLNFTNTGLWAGSTIEIRDAQLIDLTLMFGTGNEPTTLTDNRIQNILNRGYISYNLGKYKESDIGVVSTTKADTTVLDTITFKAQLGGAINSHNTMEITNSAYVFTRNVGSVDLGTLNYTYQTQQQRFYSNGIQGKNSGNDASYIPNMLSSNFVVNSINGISENQMTYYNNLFFIKGSALGTTNQEAQAYLNGKYLHYELATPQVISIPRKHLGIVKIRDLSWNYDSGLKVFHNDGFAGKSQGGMYCSAFLTNTNLYASNLVDLTMTNRPYYTQHNICIKDLAIVSTADFLNEYGDYLIFYETENEVADIENVVDIESGGTITTDSEVLADIELLVKGK